MKYVIKNTINNVHANHACPDDFIMYCIKATKNNPIIILIGENPFGDPRYNSILDIIKNPTIKIIVATSIGNENLPFSFIALDIFEDTCEGPCEGCEGCDTDDNLLSIYIYNNIIILLFYYFIIY